MSKEMEEADDFIDITTSAMMHKSQKLLYFANILDVVFVFYSTESKETSYLISQGVLSTTQRCSSWARPPIFSISFKEVLIGSSWW